MGLFKGKDSREDVTDSNVNSESVSHLKGDRNDISVSGKSGDGKKKILLIVIFLAFAFMCFMLLGFYYFKSENEVALVEVQDAEKEQYQRAQTGAEGLDDLKRQQERLERSLATLKDEAEAEEEEKPVVVPQIEQPPVVSMPVVAAMPEPSVDSQGNPITPPSERRLQGSTLVSVDSISVPQGPSGNESAQGFSSGDNGDFLKGASFADGYVTKLQNRSFLLPAGTAAPCVLKTKIVTSYPGFVMCQLTKNIYSDDGTNILVRAGAEFHGEQTKVMQQGIARVFVNWSTLKDRNMKIRIDALGADGLGAAGLPAWIDNHFWDRFGGAIMLSFIDDAIAAAASQATKSNNNDGITFDNSQNTASNMAEIALENSINIPPTAIVNQGEMLTVIVPRYIDFSSVYQNR